MVRRSVLLLLLALVSGMLSAQQNDIPLQRDIYLDVERNAACRTARIHSGMKPILRSRADLTHVMGFRPDKGRYYYKLQELVFKRHLIQVRQRDVRIDADLMLDLQMGQDFRDNTGYADTTRFYQNTRGFHVSGDLGPRFSFESSFYENQVIYPQYLWQYTRDRGVVPGQGRTKPFNGRAYDFAWATGNISWSPRKSINLQLGQGKHFIGHGYRSMLLSDASCNYPFFKVSLLGWQDRIQYTTIHGRLQMLQRLPEENITDTIFENSSESLFYWKPFTFNHLSIHLGPVELGLFEGSVFQALDSAGALPFNALTLNPIIGINTAVNGFNSAHKQVLGVDLCVKLTDKFNVYGQGMTDKPGRYGWQAGFRWFDLFGTDLHLQMEYNHASPFLYKQDRYLMNYSHTQEALAHPYGAYFDEAVVIVDYRFKERYLFQAKVNLATYHTDSLGYNYGGDILKNDVPIEGPGGPLQQRLTYVDVNASYLINQMSNMRITLGYWMRDLTPAPDHRNTGYLYGAFRMALFNRYYDF